MIKNKFRIFGKNRIKSNKKIINNKFKMTWQNNNLI